MRNAWAYAGWFLAAVAAAVAVALLVSARHQTAELADLRAQAASLAQQVERLNTALSEKATAPPEAKPAAPPADGAPGEPGQPPANATSLLGKMMAAIVGTGTGDKAENKEGNPFAGLAKMYSGEQGKELARQGAQMQVGMQYGELFTSLHVPPDVEERVRKVLTDNAVEQITAAMDALQDNPSPDTLKKLRDDATAKQRAELSAILSPEEMATFDEYETTLPKRMLTQSFDMQLNMFAPGLTAENRTRARDALVEEMLQMRDGQRGSFPGKADVQSYVSDQQQAFTRARDRLAQEFDEAQLAHVDRFIAQAQQMAETSMRMFGSMRAPEDKPK